MSNQATLSVPSTKRLSAIFVTFYGYVGIASQKSPSSPILLICEILYVIWKTLNDALKTATNWWRWNKHRPQSEQAADGYKHPVCIKNNTTAFSAVNFLPGLNVVCNDSSHCHSMTFHAQHRVFITFVSVITFLRKIITYSPEWFSDSSPLILFCLFVLFHVNWEGSKGATKAKFVWNCYVFLVRYLPLDNTNNC